MTSIISSYHEHDELIKKTSSNHTPNPIRPQSEWPNPNDSVLKFGRINLWSDR